MTSPPPPPSAAASTASVLDLAPVVPVVVLDDVSDAVPLARALVAGGLPAIEVTLRTPVALDAIREISGAVPEAVVGAGTVIAPEQVTACAAAGARFLVSPGWTEVLLTAMRASGLPFLPGVSTTSEVVALLERGVREMKFFPAQAAGVRRICGRSPGRSPRPASARRAGSARTTRRSIWRCRTWRASAGPGCCRSGRGGGAGLGSDRGPGARRPRAQGLRWDVSLKRRTLALPSA